VLIFQLTHIKGEKIIALMLTAQDRVWLKHWQENSPEIRKSAIEWRKQPAFHRIDKPSRIAKARRLGYKAKQGIVVIRTRVGTGGMRRQRPVAGRRQKHLGVTRIKADINMQGVAEQRTAEKYKNLKLLGSYFLYKDGFHYWFEIILADKAHPRIVKDKELRKRVIPA
jgi:large subunit ribosomal protein L15e